MPRRAVRPRRSEHPASLVELAEPGLPRGDWARIRSPAEGSAAATCISSIARWAAPPHWHRPSALRSRSCSDTRSPVWSSPSGPSAVPVGTRVAVLPDINCDARGIDPVCRACARGWPSSCHNAGWGVLTPGSALGFTSDLGGGWAEQVVAHSSMLFALPDSVPDAAATLHEPVSIAVHGLLRAPMRDGDPVLVIGAAIIGLATVAAIRALFPNSPVTVLARHDRQAAAAHAVGADTVIRADDDGAHFDALAERASARVSGLGRSPDADRRVSVRRRCRGLPGYRHGSVASRRQPRDRVAVGCGRDRRVRPLPAVVERGRVRGRRPSLRRSRARRRTDCAFDRPRARDPRPRVPPPHGRDHPRVPSRGTRDTIATALDRQAGAIKVVFRPPL